MKEIIRPNISDLEKEMNRLYNLVSMTADYIYEYDAYKDILSMVELNNDNSKEYGKIIVEHFRRNTGKIIHPDDVAMYHQLLEDIAKGERIRNFEIRAKINTEDFEWVCFDVNISTDEDNKLEKIFGRIFNVSEWKKKEMSMNDETRRDPFTKLFNKTYSTEVISHQIRNNGRGTLFIIDLDNFKMVNDTMGHLFGDVVLANAAKAIAGIFRENDIVGRIGGDEFIAYMCNCSSREDIERKAEKICEVISRIYIGEQKKFSLSASVGISVVPECGEDFNTAFSCADRALYHVKNTGKNSFYIYNQSNEDKFKEEEQYGRIQEDQYTTFGKDDDYQVDEFAYELTEAAFKLMDETTDVDSAVNLLLIKVKEHYKLDSVSVMTITEVPNTLEYVYEVVGDKMPKMNYVIENYDGETWKNITETPRNAVTCVQRYNKKLNSPVVEATVSLFNRKDFIGCIKFARIGNRNRFNDKDFDGFRAFARIISAYVLNMKKYEDTTKLVDKMGETDALTGLYKYEKFQEIIKSKKDEILTRNNILLVYADISGFKFINETYGYAVGDTLLKTFADGLKQQTVFCAARVYSDNLIGAYEIAKNLTKEDVLKIIKKSNLELEEEFQSRFFDNKLTINSGAYIMTRNDDDVEVACTNANFARKQAKNNSTGPSCMVYDEKMIAEVKKYMRLTNDLPRAIATEEIKIYMQPKMECGTGRIVGAEALVRWQKNNGRFIYPDEFIPVFEKNGSIIQIDYYVYRKVFEYLADRIAQRKPVVPVSLNVSRIHLYDENLFTFIDELFEKYKVPPEYIEFEFTENIYIENLEQLRRFIEGLKLRGVKVSMDDFGSGFSSLNLLSRLPIDILKLDKVFMKNEVLEYADEVIVGSIVTMAKKLGMKTLCEGVETKEQDAFLSRIGCDMVQGYLFSKPINLDDFTEFMEKHLVSEVDVIRFTFNNTLDDEEGRFTGRIVGKDVTFVEGPMPGMGAVRFGGNNVGMDVIELPPQIYTTSSFSISAWVKEEEANIWSSFFYTSFQNGFASIMTRSWQLKPGFRIKGEADESPWCDAGSDLEAPEGWNFYVATFNAETKVMTLFINGQRAGIYTNATELNLVNRVLVGGDVYKEGIKGCVSDLCIYNTSLNSIEIDNLYKGYKSLE